MSKKHTNFLLVALLSFLSLLIMFSCKLSSSKIEPANTETGDNTDTGTGGSEDTQTEDQELPEVLSGEFSVSADKKVQFTRGNLYCTIENDIRTWGIEVNQYDYRDYKVENDTKNIGLFFWSSSPEVASSHVYISSASPNFAFAKSEDIENLKEYDVLTREEWTHLINKKNKNGMATIITEKGNVMGRIFLPEDWNIPDDLSFKSEEEAEGDNNYNFSTNTYSNDDWIKMEGAGAVFLPNAGIRTGTMVDEQPLSGYYWSSTYVGTSDKAYVLTLGGGFVYDTLCSKGNSVRLVKRVE